MRAGFRRILAQNGPLGASTAHGTVRRGPCRPKTRAGPLVSLLAFGLINSSRDKKYRLRRDQPLYELTAGSLHTCSPLLMPAAKIEAARCVVSEISSLLCKSSLLLLPQYGAACAPDTLRTAASASAASLLKLLTAGLKSAVWCAGRGSSKITAQVL